MKIIRKFLAGLLVAAAFLSPLAVSWSVRADNVMPVFKNDTLAHSLSFNDTFGHSVIVGTYDPVSGLWTAAGSNVTSVGLTTPAWLTVTGSPVTTMGTLAITATSEPQNLVLASPNGSSGGMGPRALVTPDLSSVCTNGQVFFNNAGAIGCVTSSGTGTVTSVSLAAPAWLTITGSPITTSGTFTISSTSEPQNQVLASPNGSTGAMAPRALLTADLSATCSTGQNFYNNAGAIGCQTPGVGTVTSVAMTVPSWLAVGGSPITTSGTFALTTPNQSANFFLASPSGGSGALSPRAIVSADIAAVLASPPCFGCTVAGTGAFTALSATSFTDTGLATLSGAANISGSSGTQPTINATNAGTATAYTTAAFLFTASEGYASFGSANTHFGSVMQATKNVLGSTTTGSRIAWTGQQLGVGGDTAAFFTAGFELTEPCLAPVTCNAFNLSGNFTGNNPYVYVPAGMTPTTAISEEIDNTVLSAGATQRGGLRIVDLGGTQHGTIDAAINVVSSGVGWNTLIYAGDTTATFGLNAGGEFLNTPVTTVALKSFFNFTNISGVPTLGGIVFAANAGQNLCWGTTASCLGGQVRSLTTTAGMSISFGASYVLFQPQGGASALYIEPLDVLLPPQTIANLPTCNSGLEGRVSFVKDTVGSAAPTFHLIVAGGGATTVHSLASCNGTNWVYD